MSRPAYRAPSNGCAVCDVPTTMSISPSAKKNFRNPAFSS
jgi:hypothetical protein